MFGGGGLNPRKMKQMMEQMGIDLEELEAESVTISLSDGSRLSFSAPDVTKMEARGQETYQIVGEPDILEGDDEVVSHNDREVDEGDDIPDEDVVLVTERTGASEDAAREALEAENGDLAAAINRLE